MQGFFLVHHHHHHQRFLEWPKQQRHHEDHYSQSRYRQYQSVLLQQRNKYVLRWRRKVDRDRAEVTSSGKLFQTLAPAIGKAQLPTVGRQKDVVKVNCSSAVFTLHYITLHRNYL